MIVNNQGLKHTGDDGAMNTGRRVYEYVELVAADRRYLDKEIEWKIIDNTVFSLGIPPLDANSFLQGAATIGQFSTETLVMRALNDIASGMRKRSPRISSQQFEFLTDAAIGLSKGEIDRDDARGLVKAACEQADLRAARRGLFRTRRWYRSIPDRQQLARA